MTHPAIPDSLQQRFADLIAQVAWKPDPWLPFPWPVQISHWGWAYAQPHAPDIEWTRALLHLKLSQSPMPLIRPRDPESAGSLALSFCWNLNRLVLAPRLDLTLQEAGYDPEQSRIFTLDWLTQQLEITPIPDVIQVLFCLELLYRQISIPQQTQLKAACGEDVMKAAYQLNMMCIDPEDDDRTLLQIQRIALKLCGEDQTHVQESIQIQLSDGRQL